MQAEIGKPLEIIFFHICMLAVPELVGRLGECIAWQAVGWGKLLNLVFPQSWWIMCLVRIQLGMAQLVIVWLLNIIVQLHVMAAVILPLTSLQ